MPGYSLDINPLPTVNPIGAPGGDFEHIQASPDMFGGSIARALQGFGGAVEKASDTGFNVLEQQRMMQDKTHAAELHSWGSDQWSQNSGQFLQLEGKNAVSALPAYKQRNQEILDSMASQAADPYTKLLVQSESRRIMDSHNEMAERHAAAQEKTWQHTTAQLNEASSGNQAVLFATNGDINTAKNFLFDAGQEARNQADLQGLDSKAADQLVAQKRGQYAYQIVEGLARKEGPGYGPKAALQFYQSERDKIDAGSATKIEAFLDNQLTTIIAQKRGEDAWRKASAGPPARRDVVDSAVAAWRNAGMSGNGIAGILHNIKEESGFNPELRHPDQPHWGGEAHFAHGLYQEGGEEWNNYERWLHEQHPGADWRNQALQSQFAAWNLKTNYPDVWNRMNAARSPEEAAAIYARDYLKPAAVFLHSRLSAIRQGIAPLESYGAGQGAATPAVAVGGPSVPAATPVSFQTGTPQGPETPAIFPGVPGAALAPAIVPWEAKKAAAIQDLTNDPELRDRPKQLAAAISFVRTQAEAEHAATIDGAAAEKAQEKALKTASDAAEIEVMQDAYSRAPKISAAQMLSNPHLTREAKERLLKFYPVNEDRESDLKHYGPGFFEAYKAVHAPVGDPARITDPAKLYEMTGPGGALTIAGVDKLTAEIYKPKNPETEAETEMKKTFLDSARRQVSGEGLIPGMKDPKGEQIFLGFLGYFFPAYDKARKEGKTPGELLDPNSKDYLGKSLNTMKRPMAEWYKDATSDNPQVMTGAPAAAATKPAFNAASLTSLDQLKAAVKAGTIDYAQGIQIGLQRGWIRENPVTPPPPATTAPAQVPISR